MREKQSVFELGGVLAMLGGVLTIIGGILEVTSLIGRRTLPSLDSLTNTLGSGIVMVVVGLIAVVGSRHMKSIGWDIAVVVGGALSYPLAGGFPWGWGPLLIILGGIVGIIA